MIKSEGAKVIVNGEPGQIIFELTHLLFDLIKINPELLTSVLAAYTDELESTLTKVSPDICAVITNEALLAKKAIEDE